MGTHKRGITGATPYGVSVAVVLAILSPLVKADSLVFTGSNATLSASVTFQQIGTNLQVTLVNTSTHDVLRRDGVLTAVFFTLSGNPGLGPISADLRPDATVLFSPVGGSGHNVGGEWAYRDGLRHAPGQASEGISSVGLGMFRKPNFNGSDLQPPLRVGGLDYGITSLGDDPHTGRRAVTGRNALIQDSVVFTLALPTDYALSSVSDVCFQYGRSLHGPHLIAAIELGGNPEPVVVPEPTSVGLVACGVGLLLIANRRSYRSEADKGSSPRGCTAN